MYCRSLHLQQPCSAPAPSHPSKRHLLHSPSRTKPHLAKAVLQKGGKLRPPSLPQPRRSRHMPPSLPIQRRHMPHQRRRKRFPPSLPSPRRQIITPRRQQHTKGNCNPVLAGKQTTYRAEYVLADHCILQGRCPYSFVAILTQTSNHRNRIEHGRRMTYITCLSR